MSVLIKPHVFNATVNIPLSKSHAIRHLVISALAGNALQIEAPFRSQDIESCVNACRVLSTKKPFGRLIIDAGNSGTTLFFTIAAAALLSQPVTFTGGRQIAGRSAGPLLEALAGLGIKVRSKNGSIPITICGPWKGGRVSLPCMTSQYLSAMLIAAPLAPEGTITEIDVPLLNEKPYIRMTLSYLESQGLFSETTAGPKITCSRDFSRFTIHGGNVYKPVKGAIPGDFSSAVFPAAAAVLSGGRAVLNGLDPNDTQGDKVFFEYLAKMGCTVTWKKKSGNTSDWQVTVSRAGTLRGGVFDLNATPDLLPIMAVLGAFAEGETALVNAAHARIKETDRIAAMAGELQKLFKGDGGFRCEEKPDGLIIRRCKLPSAFPGTGGNVGTVVNAGNAGITLDGCGDHRVTMALACAAMGLPEGSVAVSIKGAEAAGKSYPGFLEMLR